MKYYHFFLPDRISNHVQSLSPRSSSHMLDVQIDLVEGTLLWWASEDPEWSNLKWLELEPNRFIQSPLFIVINPISRGFIWYVLYTYHANSQQKKKYPSPQFFIKLYPWCIYLRNKKASLKVSTGPLARFLFRARRLRSLFQECMYTYIIICICA